MKDKILVNKLKIYIILKQKNNLKKNLILIIVNNQEKVDMVKLKNVKVILIKNIMQLK